MVYSVQEHKQLKMQPQNQVYLYIRNARLLGLGKSPIGTEIRHSMGFRTSVKQSIHIAGYSHINTPISNISEGQPGSVPTIEVHSKPSKATMSKDYQYHFR